ncbi:glycosyl hydrolase 115 family protein [Carboxylicivirga linearis]|uniref:Glycosyl hydrolase 115 family protein n=1 Tax=Carboxylicivirga linearis TaxID=1628157 RepID=A0ABS5JT33_9BACT|nr:glycosyl hydrolase 115 family protein [Carboxylicivirga linearis]MBS2098076.1 glycosyl hydrolase 115 family protein [Carboxylicivirga linearis]
MNFKCFLWIISLMSMFSLYACSGTYQSDFILSAEDEVPVIVINEEEDELIHWAANSLADDVESILGVRPIVQTKVNTISNNKPVIYIGQKDSKIGEEELSGSESDNGEWETYNIFKKKNALYIIGSDIRGTVYGVFDLAEKMGVSPWQWWADVTPSKSKEIRVEIPEEGIVSSPSVKFRGIFLNDEDWGLQPWAAKTFEPETGDIGPKTYEKIFQLLLRLKANTIWPAMHHCTQAFFSVEGNKEMAAKYHIILGSSHAEPMLRNNVREWNKEERGQFNYFANRENVKQYWQERINEIKDANNESILTIGMRGIHDSKMEGAKSIEDMVSIMGTIFDDQRELISTTLGKTTEEIPQVLVPYKEVLDLYNRGLHVPDDVTLMWCDDNYGYIRRLSNEEEQKRAGGAGVYYHISYWGRPHDYLWLSSTQPGLIWFEMNRAYQNGARDMWIVNVGDIKPNEYNMELFLDMAWDINSVTESTIHNHLKAYCEREFGNKNGQKIAGVLEEYYRLAFLRRPEFMGWSQTEPTTPTHLSDFSSTANNNELMRRIECYATLTEIIDEVKSKISEEKKDAFFQLVEYPVKSTSWMNRKFLFAQLAEEATSANQKSLYKNKSERAYDQIQELTMHYNTLANGKWKNMMNAAPRNLPVFHMPKISEELAVVDSVEEYKGEEPIFLQAADFNNVLVDDEYSWQEVNGLGYSGKAVTLFPLKNVTFNDEWPSLTYDFKVQEPGDYIVEIRCLPTHANNFDHQLSVQADDEEAVVYDLNTRGRSRDWKENVLRNAQVIKHQITINEKGKHQLIVKVNQTGIVLDQIAIIPAQYPNFYEIPVE